MHFRPKVSVLMPVFNAEQFLPLAIESVLRQSFADFELVLVDDGSTDGSLRAMKSYNDRRIRIVETKPNEGISASRNRAIACSEGEYIAWLDADDVAKPDRLSAQAAFLDEHSDAGLCHSNFEEIDGEGAVVREAWNGPGILPTEWLMLWTNPIAQSTVMVRRGLLGGISAPYNPECDPAEDYDLWARLALKTRMSYVPDVLVSYRTLPTSAFHVHSRKAMRKSLEANELFVGRLVGGPVPTFHKFLTSFGGVLETDIEQVNLGVLREWYHRLALIAGERNDWEKETRALIDADIRERLVGLLREKSQIRAAKGTRTLLLREQPFMLAGLGMRLLYRRIRAIARTVVKRSPGKPSK